MISCPIWELSAKIETVFTSLPVCSEESFIYLTISSTYTELSGQRRKKYWSPPVEILSTVEMAVTIGILYCSHTLATISVSVD